MPLFGYEGLIIYISPEGQGKGAANHSMAFTNLNIQGTIQCKDGWGDRENRVQSPAGQADKGTGTCKLNTGIRKEECHTARLWSQLCCAI